MLDIFYLFIYSKINVFALLILRHELDIVTHNIKKKKHKTTTKKPKKGDVWDWHALG